MTFLLFAEILFWLSVALIVFTYAGYPAVLFVLAKLSPKPIARDTFFPSVTVLIAAHNERHVIGATIENKLNQKYPAELLQIIVISDRSVDGTDEIVRGFTDRGVQLVIQEPRQGKTEALNRAAPLARGEILVFSDANSRYAPDGIAKLVRNFADPAVGYVTGKMVYVDANGSLVGQGCSAYMRYENGLRRLETAVGSVIGVDGGVDAVRRSLYEPMEADMLPDFILPLRVIARGSRVVFEPEALLQEDALEETSDEWRMRVRVILRSFRALWTMRGLLNPVRYGRVAFQLFVHKWMRYWIGLFQLVVFFSNMLLLSIPFYRIIMAMQILFYGVAALGLAAPSHRPGFSKVPFYLCLLNAASIVAFIRFLKGDRMVTWIPRKG